MHRGTEGWREGPLGWEAGDEGGLPREGVGGLRQILQLSALED